MSNRQARREQSRTTRQRQQRPATRQPSRGPSGRGPSSSNTPDWLSRPFLLGLAAVIIIIGVFGTIYLARTGGDNSVVVALEASKGKLPAELAIGATLGKPDAPLKLEAYEDYQCPFCLRYTAFQEGTIIEEYVATGKLQLSYKHLPLLGVESANAALASQCAADQGKFWQYHDELFLIQARAGQSEAERNNVGRFADNNLKELASTLGLDRAAFDACYDGREHLDLVNEQQRTARSFGMTGTPSFLLNGTPLGGGAPAQLDGWRQLLDDAYNQVTASPTPATSPTAGATATAAASATAAPTATATTAP